MANRLARLNRLSDDQLLAEIIPLAIEYRKRFGKSLGITSEIGEYKAAKLRQLKRTPGNINEGFDAKDQEEKRVQIKSRIYHRGQERTGYFNNFNFDYALLVLMSEDYEVTAIYKATVRRIKRQIDEQKYGKPSLSISKFKRIGQPVYP